MKKYVFDSYKSEAEKKKKAIRKPSNTHNPTSSRQYTKKKFISWMIVGVMWEKSMRPPFYCVVFAVDSLVFFSLFNLSARSIYSAGPILISFLTIYSSFFLAIKFYVSMWHGETLACEESTQAWVGWGKNLCVE